MLVFSEYVVPVPFAATFQPLNKYPVRARDPLFAEIETAETIPVCADGADPEVELFALYVTLYVGIKVHFA
jgi:hypothetical protein